MAGRKALALLRKVSAGEVQPLRKKTGSRGQGLAGEMVPVENRFTARDSQTGVRQR